MVSSRTTEERALISRLGNKSTDGSRSQWIVVVNRSSDGSIEGLSSKQAALYQCEPEGNNPSHILSINPTDFLATVSAHQGRPSVSPIISVSPTACLLPDLGLAFTPPQYPERVSA